MAGIRQSFIIAWAQFKTEIVSLRVIMGYILGLIGIVQYSYRYIQYTMNIPVQFLEPFILYFNSRSNLTFTLLGLFLILSDAPFVTSRSMTAIYRTTRKRWSLGLTFYILMQVSIYYIVLLAFSVISVASVAYSGNVWSRSIYRMAMYDPIAMSDYGLELPEPSLLQNYLPVDAAIHTFLLIMLYSVILGLLLFALNLNNGKLVGSIVTFVIHFLGYVMISDTSLGIPLKFSPLANTILQWHSREMPLYFSYGMFLIAILIIMMILRITVFHTDFKISVSGK